MKKKYITTIDDLLALKDTNTKIYCEDITSWYCQFIGGVLCRICTDETSMFNVNINVNGNYYILVEEPVKEADENDIGKLCKFWSADSSQYAVGILYKVDGGWGGRPYCMEASHWYKHCRPLLPAEVAEITGYKVEE